MNEDSLDRICIEDIKTSCTIGVEESERRMPTELRIGVVLYADLSSACKSDELRDSIDYSAVGRSIVEHVERSQYHLLEALAESVAQLCLSFAGVKRVDVRIEKPNVLQFARCAAVEITRGLSDRYGQRKS
ncbi:MAG: dihydroneopterin aldolase [Armatimonadota bacterium]|nr:dihydroneopterin aldolase [Armatimonadota bacterium]